MIEKFKTPFAVRNQSGSKIGKVGVHSAGTFRALVRDCARVFGADVGECVDPSRICVQFVFYQNVDGERRRQTLSVEENLDFGKVLKQNAGDSYFCVGYRLSKKDRKAAKRNGGAPSANSNKQDGNAPAPSTPNERKRPAKDATNHSTPTPPGSSAEKDKKPIPKPVAGSTSSATTSSATTSSATTSSASPARGSKANGKSSAASPSKPQSVKTPKSPKSPLHVAERVSEHHRHHREPKHTKQLDETEQFLASKMRDPVVFPGFRRSVFGAIGTVMPEETSGKKRSMPLTRDASMSARSETKI